MLGWREIASWIIGAIAPDDAAVGVCATTVVRSAQATVSTISANVNASITPAQATVSTISAEADASVTLARATTTIKGGCDDCDS